MLGDFNDLIHNGGRIGGRGRNDDGYVPFKNMLRACGLTELPSSGNSFTWGGKTGDLWIQSKLDRGFGNRQWFSLYMASNQKFLEKKGFDHRLVPISLMASVESYRGCFRFDKRFLNKPRVKETILNSWNHPLHFSQRGYSMAERLSACRKALSY